MSKATIAAGAFVTVLILLVLVLVIRGPALERDVEPAVAASPAVAPSAAEHAEVQQGFLYGRIAAGDATYEGRLRWGRSEEHTSELQSQSNLVCRLLLEKKK